MNSIDLMVEEHKYITRMLIVVRNACLKLMNDDEIDYDDFNKMVDFVANYADVHHHGKEEKFLFKEMAVNLGKVGEKLINNGMLVEHDWGRLFVMELKESLIELKNGNKESKLDVIANAVGYANHLDRHIKKEDSVIYPFAQRQLTNELLEKVDKASEEFEEEASNKGIQDYYIKLLEGLETKYSS